MAARRKSSAKARKPKGTARPKRPRRSKQAKPEARRRKRRPVPKRRTVAKRRARPKAARVSKPALDLRELIHSLERKVRRLGSARRTLEKRLTAAVQEIGALRQFELRALMLEEELRKRDRESDGLRRDGAGRDGVR